MLPDPIQICALIMARKFITGAGQVVGRNVRKANTKRKRIAAQVNKLDRQLGGLVLQNPLSQAVVPYLNAAGAVMDVFDDIMGVETHPQANGAQVAGVANGMVIRRSNPKFMTSRGTIRIQHKELVGQVSILGSGAVATSVSTFPSGRSAYFVSPTNQNLFPWLSSIAGNYDYFRFKRLRLVYVPTCSTSTAGRVMLGYDPDGIDAIPFERSSLAAYGCSVESSTWGITKLDCSLKTGLDWYNTDDAASTALLPTTTQGQVFWSTWAGNSSLDVGEWYVLYDVELKDPTPNISQLYTAAGSGGAVTAGFSNNSPVSYVPDAATTVKVLFTGTGTYLINLIAASTAVGAEASGGQITIIGTTQKANNGTLTVVTAAVRISGNGFSVSPGITSSPTFWQINGMTGLAGWELHITRIPPINTYPVIT